MSSSGTLNVKGEKMMVLRAYKRWTDDDYDELVRMLTVRVDIQDMAEILQISEGSIRWRIEWLYRRGAIRIIDWRRPPNGGAI